MREHGMRNVQIETRIPGKVYTKSKQTYAFFNLHPQTLTKTDFKRPVL